MRTTSRSQPTIWTLLVERSYPVLGLEPGDVVCLEPGSPEPVTIHRAVPANYGALLEAIEAGALRSLNPDRPVEPIVRFLAWQAGAPLRLLK
jgi:hypothetical protein